jgi:membrane AbrB-like protein
MAEGPVRRIAPTLLALCAGAAGAALATLAGIPAPFVTGPAIAVTLASLAGARFDLSARLRDAVFAVIGMVMGSGVTPQALAALIDWPVSFLLLALSVVAILWTCRLALSRGFGIDRRTAVLASSPGHLSFVLGLGAELGGDIAAIAIIQSIRLLSLTLLVPPLVVLFGGELPDVLPPMQTMALPALAILIAASAAAGYALVRLRVPAAYLIGGMAVSTATHASGMVEGGVPQWLAIPCFVFMGTLIGARFSGVSLAMLRRHAAAGAISTLVTVAIALGAALLAWRITGLPVMLLLLAFAPGGVETMAAIAFLLNADPAFVAAHHVFRLFVLSALVPAFLALRRTA